MPAQLEMPEDFAAALALISEPRIGGQREQRTTSVSEMKLQMLAYEMARYRPVLARKLVSAGRRKIAAM